MVKKSRRTKASRGCSSLAITSSSSSSVSPTRPTSQGPKDHSHRSMVAASLSEAPRSLPGSLMASPINPRMVTTENPLNSQGREGPSRHNCEDGVLVGGLKPKRVLSPSGYYSPDEDEDIEIGCGTVVHSGKGRCHEADWSPHHQLQSGGSSGCSNNDDLDGSAMMQHESNVHQDEDHDDATCHFCIGSITHSNHQDCHSDCTKAGNVDHTDHGGEEEENLLIVARSSELMGSRTSLGRPSVAGLPKVVFQGASSNSNNNIYSNPNNILANDATISRHPNSLKGCIHTHNNGYSDQSGIEPFQIDRSMESSSSVIEQSQQTFIQHPHQHQQQSFTESSLSQSASSHEASVKSRTSSQSSCGQFEEEFREEHLRAKERSILSATLKHLAVVPSGEASQQVNSEIPQNDVTDQATRSWISTMFDRIWDPHTGKTIPSSYSGNTYPDNGQVYTEVNPTTRMLTNGSLVGSSHYPDQEEEDYRPAVDNFLQLTNFEHWQQTDFCIEKELKHPLIVKSTQPSSSPSIGLLTSPLSIPQQTLQDFSSSESIDSLQQLVLEQQHGSNMNSSTSHTNMALLLQQFPHHPNPHLTTVRTPIDTSSALCPHHHPCPTPLVDLPPELRMPSIDGTHTIVGDIANGVPHGKVTRVTPTSNTDHPTSSTARASSPDIHSSLLSSSSSSVSPSCSHTSLETIQHQSSNVTTIDQATKHSSTMIKLRGDNRDRDGTTISNTTMESRNSPLCSSNNKSGDSLVSLSSPETVLISPTTTPVSLSSLSNGSLSSPKSTIASPIPRSVGTPKSKTSDSEIGLIRNSTENVSSLLTNRNPLLMHQYPTISDSHTNSCNTGENHQSTGDHQTVHPEVSEVSSLQHRQSGRHKREREGEDDDHYSSMRSTEDITPPSSAIDFEGVRMFTGSGIVVVPICEVLNFSGDNDGDELAMSKLSSLLELSKEERVASASETMEQSTVGNGMTRNTMAGVDHYSPIRLGFSSPVPHQASLGTHGSRSSHKNMHNYANYANDSTRTTRASSMMSSDSAMTGSILAGMGEEVQLPRELATQLTGQIVGRLTGGFVQGLSRMSEEGGCEGQPTMSKGTTAMSSTVGNSSSQLSSPLFASPSSSSSSSVTTSAHNRGPSIKLRSPQGVNIELEDWRPHGSQMLKRFVARMRGSTGSTENPFKPRPTLPLNLFMMKSEANGSEGCDDERESEDGKPTVEGTGNEETVLPLNETVQFERAEDVPLSKSFDLNENDVSDSINVCHDTVELSDDDTEKLDELKRAAVQFENFKVRRRTADCRDSYRWKLRPSEAKKKRSYNPPPLFRPSPYYTPASSGSQLPSGHPSQHYHQQYNHHNSSSNNQHKNSRQELALSFQEELARSQIRNEFREVIAGAKNFLSSIQRAFKCFDASPEYISYNPLLVNKHPNDLRQSYHSHYRTLIIPSYNLPSVLNTTDNNTNSQSYTPCYTQLLSHDYNPNHIPGCPLLYPSIHREGTSPPSTLSPFSPQTLPTPFLSFDSTHFGSIPPSASHSGTTTPTKSTSHVTHPLLGSLPFPFACSSTNPFLSEPLESRQPLPGTDCLICQCLMAGQSSLSALARASLTATFSIPKGLSGRAPVDYLRPPPPSSSFCRCSEMDAQHEQWDNTTMPAMQEGHDIKTGAGHYPPSHSTSFRDKAKISTSPAADACRGTLPKKVEHSRNAAEHPSTPVAGSSYSPQAPPSHMPNNPFSSSAPSSYLHPLELQRIRRYSSRVKVSIALVADTTTRYGRFSLCAFSTPRPHPYSSTSLNGNSYYPQTSPNESSLSSSSSHTSPMRQSQQSMTTPSDSSGIPTLCCRS